MRDKTAVRLEDREIGMILGLIHNASIPGSSLLTFADLKRKLESMRDDLREERFNRREE